MATENKKMQQRRDTAADWTSGNPTLSAGEIGFETDTGKFKIGDGAAAWNSITDYFMKIPNAVSATELGYLDGVTSAIQTQIGGKQDSDAMLTSLSTLTDPNADRILFWDDSAGDFVFLTLPPNAEISGTGLRIYEKITIACSDETTDLATGTLKTSFRNRGGTFNVTAVFAEVNTAPTGATLIVDINEGDTPTSILSTKLSIDAGEKDSSTAASAAVISDSPIADNALISIDIDQVGSTVPGKGLKVTLRGYYS